MEDAARGFNNETAEVNGQTAAEFSKFRIKFSTCPCLLTNRQINKAGFLVL